MTAAAHFRLTAEAARVEAISYNLQAQAARIAPYIEPSKRREREIFFNNLAVACRVRADESDKMAAEIEARGN